MVAPALQKTARVISVDQRGRGNSAWDTDPANYTVAVYAKDMFRLIEHLQLKNIVLVGTSMGGVISFLMVAMQPTLFKGVVLNDIGPVVNPAGLTRIMGYVGKSKPIRSIDDAIEQLQASNGDAHPVFTRGDWERWANRLYEKNAQGELVLRYDPKISQPLNEDDTAAAPADLWNLFAPMTALPLLTIRGELSDILAEDCIAEMQAQHSSMQQIEVANVGHAPELIEPGVLEAISGFVVALMPLSEHLGEDH